MQTQSPANVLFFPPKFENRAWAVDDQNQGKKHRHTQSQTHTNICVNSTQLAAPQNQQKHSQTQYQWTYCFSLQNWNPHITKTKTIHKRHTASKSYTTSRIHEHNPRVRNARNLYTWRCFILKSKHNRQHYKWNREWHVHCMAKHVYIIGIVL